MTTKIKLKRNVEVKPYDTVAYSVDKDITPESIAIGYGWPKIKSHLKLGNLTIHNTHRFNWFERKMWKLFFGFEIENVEE